MPSADTADKLFWLAYCSLIRKQAGGFGRDDAIFFSTRSQRGPPAGDSIDPAYTNIGIYDIGNNLLRQDSLFYAPSNSNSYIRSLLTYLNYVDLGGNPSDANLIRVKQTAEAMDAANKGMLKALTDALEEYKTLKAAGLIGEQTFPQWYPTNALAYTQALAQFQSASSANDEAIREAYGNNASQYLIDKNNIVLKAMGSTTNLEQPGDNMPCTDLDPPTAREILNNFNNGQPVPKPAGLYYVPQYRSPGYTSTVKFWENTSNAPPKPQQFSVTMNKGKEVDVREFGQTKVGTGVGFDFDSWISFGISGSYEKKEESFNTENEAEQIEVTVTFNDARAVPGDAPLSTKMLVRPSQMVLIQNLGFKVKFGVKLSTQFDKKVSETTEADGYVRVFGIPIKIGGDVKKSTQTTSHVGTWDNSSGEFEVTPTQDAGWATIAAIVGEKISTI